LVSQEPISLRETAVLQPLFVNSLSELSGKIISRTRNFQTVSGTNGPRIVSVEYPEWRGYDFILVHGRYIIVRPQTHEIVYIIEG